MSHNPELLSAPSQSHQDYKRTLEVMREVAETLVDDETRAQTRAVIKAARDITYDAGVRSPRAFVGWAVWLTKAYAPARAVEEAEQYTFWHSKQKAWVYERPQRPNDLAIEELLPGTRLLIYNDERGDSAQQLARHEVVVSMPYIRETTAGRPLVAILARSVQNHNTDSTPLDSPEDVREVPLSAWGITPNTNGLYSQTKFAELFIGQNKPIQVLPAPEMFSEIETSLSEIGL